MSNLSALSRDSTYPHSLLPQAAADIPSKIGRGPQVRKGDDKSLIVCWSIMASLTAKRPTALISFAVPGRPIGPWSRRTGAPEASATGRDQTPMLTRLLTGRAATHRDEPIRGGTTLGHPPCLKSWKNPKKHRPIHSVCNLGAGCVRWSDRNQAGGHLFDAFIAEYLPYKGIGTRANARHLRILGFWEARCLSPILTG